MVITILLLLIITIAINTIISITILIHILMCFCCSCFCHVDIMHIHTLCTYLTTILWAKFSQNLTQHFFPFLQHFAPLIHKIVWNGNLHIILEECNIE